MESAALDALSLNSEPSDSDDIRWALETASAMWNKGDHYEALRWLRRAAETAGEEGDDARAVQLAKMAAELRGRLSLPRTEPPAQGAALTVVDRVSRTDFKEPVPPRNQATPSTRAGRAAAASNDALFERAAEALLESAPSIVPGTPLGLRPPTLPPASPSPAGLQTYQAIRVAITNSHDTPGVLTATILAPGQQLPPGAKEALCVALEAGVDLRS
jgi:hypothetical protein